MTLNHYLNRGDKMTNMNDCYNNLPKLATVYGFVAAYITTVNRDGDLSYLCVFKSSMNQPWNVVSFASWEIAAFYDHSRSEQAINEACELFPDFKIVQLPKPISLESIDPQLLKNTGHGFSGHWMTLKTPMGTIGFKNEQEKVIAIDHDDDLFRLQQVDIILDGAGFNLVGIRDDYQYGQFTPMQYGFASIELVESKSIERAQDLADEIRTWNKNKHQRITMINTVAEWDIERQKPENKTLNASKVLRLMDSVDDGQDRYCEFVKQVADQAGITIDALDAELEPFI